MKLRVFLFCFKRREIPVYFCNTGITEERERVKYDGVGKRRPYWERGKYDGAGKRRDNFWKNELE